jgi:hypothetical protein
MRTQKHRNGQNLRVKLPFFGNTITAFFLKSHAEAGLHRPGYVALRHVNCPPLPFKKADAAPTLRAANAILSGWYRTCRFRHGVKPDCSRFGGGASLFRVAYWCVPRPHWPPRYDKKTKYNLQCPFFRLIYLFQKIKEA